MWAKKEIGKENGGKKIVFQTRVKFFLPPPLREKKLWTIFYSCVKPPDDSAKNVEASQLAGKRKEEVFQCLRKSSTCCFFLLSSSVSPYWTAIKRRLELNWREEGGQSQLTQSNPSFLLLPWKAKDRRRRQQQSERRKVLGIVPTNLHHSRTQLPSPALFTTPLNLSHLVHVLFTTERARERKEKLRHPVTAAFF